MAHYFPMPEGYRCPLCPDHEDDDFCWDPLLSSPICVGCAHEIINLVCDVKRIKDSVLDQLELVTGLTYHELQVVVLMPWIRNKEKILGSRELAAKHKNAPQMNLDEWIEDQKEDLARMRRVVAIAKARIRQNRQFL
jgi:hypothetical protein